MKQLYEQIILVVDDANESTASLRQRLVDYGATVHVVSTNGAAALLAATKHIDLAMIGFNVPNSQELRACLEAHGVSQIYCATSAEPLAQTLATEPHLTA